MLSIICDSNLRAARIMNHTLVLCAHGSLDPRQGEQLHALIARVQAAYPQPVRGAVLEMGAVDLPSQLQQIVLETQVAQVILVPLFITPGHHVERDLPEALRAVPGLRWQKTPTLSESLVLTTVVRQQVAHAEQVILFAHGSRRSSAHTPIHTLATQLGRPSHPIFYQTDPTALPRALANFSTGFVLPLFVFEGGLTDWAQAQVAQTSGWTCGKPLGVGETLLPVIFDLLEQIKVTSYLANTCP